MGGPAGAGRRAGRAQPVRRPGDRRRLRIGDRRHRSSMASRCTTPVRGAQRHVWPDRVPRVRAVRADLPVARRWDYLPAAHAASLVFDLVTIGGTGAARAAPAPGDATAGELGLALGWAWAACPFTLLGLMDAHQRRASRDAVRVRAARLRFAGRRAARCWVLQPRRSSAPAALLPLFAGRRDASGCEGRGHLRSRCVHGRCVAGSIGLFLPPGGLERVLQPHARLPDQPHRRVFAVGAAPGAGPAEDGARGRRRCCSRCGVALVPRERVAASRSRHSLRRSRSRSSSPALHWFYYYIAWFLPFVLVALLAAPNARRRRRMPERRGPAHEAAPAGPSA